MSSVPHTFDFDVADCPSFVSRINDLRNQLWDRSRPALFDGLHMLRPYTTVPRQWLLLRMVAGHNSIVLLVRMDNLYVVGFRQEGQRGRTWEFGSGSGRLIPGSEPLRFDGGYTGNNLGELQTGPPPGQRRRPDLGRQQLIAGIQGLAAYDGGGASDVRTWLRTIVVTMSESIRSQEVCSYVANILRGGGSGWLSTRMICIIKNWEKISVCLIQSANDPDIPGLYRYLRAKGICGNTYEARQVVAIVYHGPSSEFSSSTSLREKRAAAAAAVVRDVPAGLTFFEVFAVVILDIDGEDPGDLFGSVTIDDGLGQEVVFRRERSNTQPVGPGGLAELTGPRRALWCYDEVVFDFDLADADFFPDLSPNDEISKGQAVWNAHQRPQTEYNRVNWFEVKGKCGAVQMHYAVVTDAVVANVAVYLTNGDGESEPDLYGSIKAATSAPELQSYRITLFRKQRKEVLPVKAGHSIPLLRDVLVVPLGSSLKIDADLWDGDFFPDISSDDQIARGEAVFDARLAGVQRKVITGPNGLVTVQVTWSRT